MMNTTLNTTTPSVTIPKVTIPYALCYGDGEYIGPFWALIAAVTASCEYATPERSTYVLDGSTGEIVWSVGGAR